MTTNRVQQSTQYGQAEPTPEYKYIVQPGHPLYGIRVQIISTRKSPTYTRCVIADPNHPSFHYHINQRWLSETQPPHLGLAKQPHSPVVIALAALDKLVQYILIHQELRRTSYHASDQLQCPTALAGNPAGSENSVELSSFPGGEEDSRRAIS